MIRLLPPVVGEPPRPRSASGLIPLLENDFFTAGGMRAHDLIVLHSTEGGEIRNSARNSAAWWQDDRAKASCAFVVDNLEIIQALENPDTDKAWHCGSANAWSVGIEHVGKASQTRQQWMDEYSLATLMHGVEVCAWLCRRYAIPVEFVDSNRVSSNRAQWKAGQRATFRGITDHASISKAFPGEGGHTDPGVAFPVDWYLARVSARMGESA